jgi:hypothetical protein
MNEPRSVSISANPAPFVGSLVGKRMASFSDGRPGTNNGRSCPGVVFLDAPEQIMEEASRGWFFWTPRNNKIEEAAQGDFFSRRNKTMDGTPDGHALL